MAAAQALREGDSFVAEVNDLYRKRRDVLVDGLGDRGWKIERPSATMFVWAKVPDPYLEMGSLEFSIHLLERAGVAVSPGVGFGETGEGHVRFALVEDVNRIETAVERIGDALDRL
jgi:alanine-synthesizing transaminase